METLNNFARVTQLRVQRLSWEFCSYSKVDYPIMQLPLGVLLVDKAQCFWGERSSFVGRVVVFALKVFLPHLLPHLLLLGKAGWEAAMLGDRKQNPPPWSLSGEDCHGQCGQVEVHRGPGGHNGRAEICETTGFTGSQSSLLFFYNLTKIARP